MTVEIDVGTADIFDINENDISTMDCAELNNLLEEINYLVPELNKAKEQRAKQVEIIAVAGSNITINTIDAIEYIELSKERIKYELNSRCK
jgi:hypothetical protein